MGSISRTDLDLKLLRDFITPSWVNTLLAVVIGIAVSGGTIILTLFGSVVQQSIVGLQGVYRNTSFATSVDTVSGHFTSNTALGNTLLFISWGMVGLVIFSVIQVVTRGIKRVDESAMELHYVHADRHEVIKEFTEHFAIRFISLGVLLLSVHYYIYTLAPNAIAAAHTSAYRLGNFHDWVHCLITALVCVIGVLFFGVLLHFVFMRPRLFGNNEIIE